MYTRDYIQQQFEERPIYWKETVQSAKLLPTVPAFWNPKMNVGCHQITLPMLQILFYIPRRAHEQLLLANIYKHQVFWIFNVIFQLAMHIGYQHFNIRTVKGIVHPQKLLIQQPIKTLACFSNVKQFILLKATYLEQESTSTRLIQLLFQCLSNSLLCCNQVIDTRLTSYKEKELSVNKQTKTHYCSVCTVSQTCKHIFIDPIERQ